MLIQIFESESNDHSAVALFIKLLGSQTPQNLISVEDIEANFPKMVPKSDVNKFSEKTLTIYKPSKKSSLIIEIQRSNTVFCDGTIDSKDRKGVKSKI